MSAVATAPAAPAATETKTAPVWVKIERPEMDKMVRFGSDEFIKTTIPTLSMERLEAALAWANEKNGQKRPGHFLVFPVSKPKQVSAGKLYLGSLSRFMKAVQAELNKRVAEQTFGAEA